MREVLAADQPDNLNSKTFYMRSKMFGENPSEGKKKCPECFFCFDIKLTPQLIK